MEPIHTVTSSPAYPAQADPLLKTVKALPAQNSANVHEALDFGQPTLYPASNDVALEIQHPAMPNLADGQSVTLTVKDSADNVTFAAIPELAQIVATGAGGVGAAAQTVRFGLPGTTRRYLRVEQSASVTAGDNTGVSVTAQLLVRL